MEAAIDRVINTYGMISGLSAEQEMVLREKVARHLKGRDETDENSLAVEGLRYARELSYTPSA